MNRQNKTSISGNGNTHTAHCENLSYVFHNRLLAWHSPPTVSISLCAAVVLPYGHKNPRSCQKMLIIRPCGSVFNCLISCFSQQKLIVHIFPSQISKHVSLHPATSSASAVPECPLVLHGCRGDSDGECQHGWWWGLGCCFILSPRPVHWVVLWSLTWGCVCLSEWHGELEGGERSSSLNPTC